MIFKTAFALFLSLACWNAHAIPEEDYAAQYEAKVYPFLQKEGVTFSFTTFDNLKLSAVKFIHPPSSEIKKPIRTLLVLVGQGETWLKYGEVFYDFYQKGYDIYAYDHRGQGLSPHLAKNEQVDHVRHFRDFSRDLNTFVQGTIIPEVKHRRNGASTGHLFLLAHSMGGAVSAEYLSKYDSPFRAAVLNAPMLQINTTPYSERVAFAIVATATGVGLGKRYPIGRGGYDSPPFDENNPYTHSPERYWMKQEIARIYPQTKMGDPSNRWVYESIRATRRIQKEIRNLKTPTLILQAMEDQIVKLEGQKTACDRSEKCSLAHVEGAKHEILMEKDLIRNQVFELIELFFGSH